MPVKFRKKIRKKRGTKSCGHGMKKKHRGGGSRGGRGNAGFGKHKKTYIYTQGIDHFGKSGFTPINRVRIETVNVSELEKMEKGGVVDAPVKVLGAGQITKPITVRVLKVSARAKEKIEKAGGKVETKEKVNESG